MVFARHPNGLPLLEFDLATYLQAGRPSSD